MKYVVQLWISHVLGFVGTKRSSGSYSALLLLRYYHLRRLVG